MARQIAPLRQAAANSAGRNATRDRVVAQLQSGVRHHATPVNTLLDKWLTTLLLDASEPYGRAAAGAAAGSAAIATRVLPPGFVTSSYHDDYCRFVATLTSAPAAADPAAPRAPAAASLPQYCRRVAVIMAQYNVVRRADFGTHVFCDCCSAWHSARASARASSDDVRAARLVIEHRAHLRCIDAEHQLGRLFASLAVDCTRTDRPAAATPAAPRPGAHAPISVSYFITDRPSTTPMVKELRASKGWAHSKDFIFSGQGIYSAAGGGRHGESARVSINYSTRIFVLGANKTADAFIRELLLLPQDGLPRTVVINCDNSAAEVRNEWSIIF